MLIFTFFLSLLFLPSCNHSNNKQESQLQLQSFNHPKNSYFLKLLPLVSMVTLCWSMVCWYLKKKMVVIKCG